MYCKSLNFTDAGLTGETLKKNILSSVLHSPDFKDDFCNRDYFG